MMKIYLSYSLAPTDMHIASLLSRQAEARGIVVETAQQIVLGSIWSAIITQQIMSSSMVIAIISRDSQNVANVERELGLARMYGRPVLALIERGIYAPANLADIQWVTFDRQDLSPALSDISMILERHKNQESDKSWLVVGGLALLALYLFSQEKSPDN
jgi:hypothetical protein